MPASHTPSFDIGPLSWVKTEIEHSLTETRGSLDKLGTDAGDTKAIKQIATHLHQVTGALSMVGLGAATRFTEEVESLVATFEDTGARMALPDRIRVVRRATNQLSNYLNGLIDGESDRPMVLSASYVQVNRARGANDATESDLFAPDLSLSLPIPDDTVTLPKSEMLKEAIRQRRSLYQAGLLKLLKDRDYVSGARDMRNATLAIEALQITSPTRSFWFTASGFFDAVAANPSDSGALAVQLFGKIDQQIKLLIEGEQKVPEKLFRDLLLVIGKSQANSSRVLAIRALYRLDELLAAPTAGPGSSDDDALRAVIRSLRDHVQSAKEQWLRYTSGNRMAIDAFIVQGELLIRSSQPNAGMAELLRMLSRVGPHLKKTGVPPTESQSLEIATALLFVEASLETYFRLRPDFQGQAASVCERIRGAMSGTALQPLHASTSAMMDDISRRAQERLLVFQVGQEVQVNLTTIEATLDNFFRDSTKIGELATLSPLFAQVQGAFAMLELDEAATLNQILRIRVAEFASGGNRGVGEDADAVAEGISALGLYTAALQQGSTQPREVLLPALIRFGLAEQPAEPERTALQSPLTASDVDVGKQKVQALYEDWRQQPEQTATRDQLREAVRDLKQEAALIGDTAAVSQSAATLDALDGSFDPSKAGITEAIADLAPSNPTETPTPQLVQLLDAPSAEIDQEILDIFLEEATEVVDTIRAQLAVARQSPHDRGSLTIIRRSFHTLKGSGRMVDLIDFGEVAWNCEQVMNKRLKDDESATPGLLGFIDFAAQSFARWVEVLKENGVAQIDGEEIARLSEMLKDGQEPVFAAADAPPVVESEVLRVEEPALPEEQPFEASALEAMPEEIAFFGEPESREAMPAEIAFFDAPESPALATDDASTAMADLAEPVVESLALEPVAPDAPDTIDELAVPPSGDPLPEFDLAPLPISGVEAAPAAIEAVSAEDLFAELPALSIVPSADIPQAASDWAEPPPDEDTISVGSVELPRALFAIYLEEAQAHGQTLDAEMSALADNPAAPITYEFMRAAHTLTSSSRTTGFDALADVAHALEKWLQAAIELLPEFDREGLLVTRQAVDALGAMILSLHTRELPEARPELVVALHALREQLRAHARASHGTHWKQPRHVEIGAISDVADMSELADEPFADGIELSTADQTLTSEDDFFADDADTAAPEVTAELSGAASPEVVSDEMNAAFDFLDAPEPATIPDEQPTVLHEPAPRPPVDDELRAPPELIETPEPLAAVDEISLVQPPQQAVPPDPASVQPTPVVEPTFESGKDRRAVVDDVDRDLLPIFLDEAKEIVPQVGAALRRWRATPTDHAPLTELARHLHTLKGSARMAGLMRLGELAHVIETRVFEMERVPAPESARFDQLDDNMDRFNATLDRLGKGDLAPPIEIPALAEIALKLAGVMPAPMALLATARAEIAAEGEKLEGRERQALLRVNADLIDRFVNEAGELSITRSRVDLEVQAFKRGLLDLNENVARMKAQLRELEIGAESQIQSRTKEAEQQGEQFDPLEFDRFSRMQELTRFMAESLNDVVTLQQTLQKNIDEADLALRQQGRLNRDLQQGLMAVRLVPLGNLQDRFHRLVRQTAKELDKKVNLEFRGVRVDIDRSVLEKITAPLEHLLRNAVAHGIELPVERVARGKPEIGEISIDARQSGNEIILTFSDDGGGLNFARIREKAIAQGLLADDAEVNEAQLTQYIFMAGFTTESTVSQIAGRGVGMDVVRSEIVSLGGRIDIASSADRGTTFTISLPLTLAVTQAVMLMVGETMYAIPSVMIDQVQEFKGKRYEPLLAQNEIEWNGSKYPLRSMEALLGGHAKLSAVRHAYVVLAKGGKQRCAVQVDNIIGNREIVVKSIGPQLARIPGIAGATVLGSGQVVLIVNPVQLLYREAATVSVERAAQLTPSDGATREFEAEEGLHADASLADTIATSTTQSEREAVQTALLHNKPLVMVVDDSLTVRKITSRMLIREGFDVATAKDGVDGLQQLQDLEPDLILLDIEMPRMDGFEFARNVRLDPKLKHIPIIVISSRTADKHRNRAKELGVNEYMGKPYQEDQLLVLVRQYT